MVIVGIPDKSFDYGVLHHSDSKIFGPENNKKRISYVAIEGSNVLGILEIGKPKNHRYGKIITSNATMVRPAYRKRGVAKKLWSAMIEEQKPKFINVRTISNKGYTLVESLRKKFPNVKWKHCPDYGLRCLKK